jgi:hypothetical protein
MMPSLSPSITQAYQKKEKFQLIAEPNGISHQQKDMQNIIEIATGLSRFPPNSNILKMYHPSFLKIHLI